MTTTQDPGPDVLDLVAEPRLCPACGASDTPFAPGPRQRPRARCARCGALERHRFLAALLESMPERINNRLVLDIAPSPTVDRVLGRMAPARHLRVDFDPAADGRRVDVQASLTALPFPERSIDTLICYHVLEHVPDDATAMREIARVLRADGVGFVQVPFRPGAVTDEDPSAPEEERIRRFGQADHVRYYGEDFEDRMTAAGLRFERIDPADVLGPAVSAAMNVGRSEFVWLVQPAAADQPPIDRGALSRAVLSHLVLLWGGQAAEQAASVSDLRSRVAVLRKRNAEKAAKLAAARAAANPSPRQLLGRVARRARRQIGRLRAR